jgi:hypothetical protein
MTYRDTTTQTASCANGTPQAEDPGGSDTCGANAQSVISGHGTVDTHPYGLMTVSQVGALGQITLYDNGADVWEIGGGDYGLRAPDQPGPGAALSGFASSVESTLGQQEGALEIQGLASGTGYLDLESREIQGATPAGTGVVTGFPVTVYKLFLTGLQDPDLSGLSSEQVATIKAADAIIAQSGFDGKTAWVSVDADGYIREVRTSYTLSNGSSVNQDTVLTNFGCAGTVVMPGQTGSSAPPARCISPDTAKSNGTTNNTSPSQSTSTSPMTSTTTLPVPANPSPQPPSAQNAVFLQGDGVGNVRFGDTEDSAITALDAELGGTPVASTAEYSACAVDDAEQWKEITAFFDDGKFVGYSTLSIDGRALPVGNFVTAQGIRVGDSLTQAEKAYGSSFSISPADGGSWSATTPEGRLAGYLNSEPNNETPPSIASIDAGAVPCGLSAGS